jgi:hypothetical protein
MAHWRCRPVRQHFERETGDSTNKKKTARYLNILDAFMQKKKTFIKKSLKQTRFKMLYEA